MVFHISMGQVSKLRWWLLMITHKNQNYKYQKQNNVKKKVTERYLPCLLISRIFEIEGTQSAIFCIKTQRYD